MWTKISASSTGVEGKSYLIIVGITQSELSQRSHPSRISPKSVVITDAHQSFSCFIRTKVPQKRLPLLGQASINWSVRVDLESS